MTDHSTGQVTGAMFTVYVRNELCCSSLLEEAVDFDPMMAPLPVVTEETTCSVEDIIRRRILDQVRTTCM